MANNPAQINPSSNASDFQPTTNNPQQIGGSDVQAPTANVQPVQGNGTTSAEQLYQQAERQPSLTVQTDNFSANSVVSVQPEPVRSNNGLLAVSGALALLLVIVVVTRYLWRQIPNTATIENENLQLEEAAPPVTAAAISPKKPATKKKSATSKKKRSSRKR